MSQTPTLAQFKGAYNVDPKFLPRDTMQHAVLCVTPGLEPPQYPEIDKVADGLENLNAELGGSDRVLSYSIGFNDRTALVSFVRPELWTQSCFRKIQEFLATKAEQWRVVVPGVDDDSTIVVYPSLIAYPTTEALEVLLNRIRCKLADHQDQTEGVFERQLQFVRNKIRREVVKQLSSGEYDPVMVATFDTSRGNPDRICVWLLAKNYPHESGGWRAEDTGDGKFCGKSGGSEFDVTTKGDLVEYMSAGKRRLGSLCAYAYDKSRIGDEVVLISGSGDKRLVLQVDTNKALADFEVRFRLASAR